MLKLSYIISVFSAVSLFIIVNVHETLHIIVVGTSTWVVGYFTALSVAELYRMFTTLSHKFRRLPACLPIYLSVCLSIYLSVAL
jgi:hypothetical protein